jgi:hypothetical protein
MEFTANLKMVTGNFSLFRGLFFLAIIVQGKKFVLRNRRESQIWEAPAPTGERIFLLSEN